MSYNTRKSSRTWNGVSRWLSLGLVVLLQACAGHIPEPATPQRPSFSADPSTTAFQTVEVEAGVVGDKDQGWDTPVALKWGAGRRTELFAGWSPFVRTETGRGFEAGVGDVVLGGRHRVMDQTDSRPALAFQAAAKIPTADDIRELGSGKADFFFAGTTMKSLGRVTLVGYYQLGLLGQASGSTIVDHGLAGAAAYPFSAKVSGFVELTGLFTPAFDSEQLLTTLGLGYTVSPSLVFDLALLHVRSSGDNNTLVTLGLTNNFGG